MPELRSVGIFFEDVAGFLWGFSRACKQMLGKKSKKSSTTQDLEGEWKKVPPAGHVEKCAAAHRLLPMGSGPWLRSTLQHSVAQYYTTDSPINAAALALALSKRFGHASM